MKVAIMINAAVSPWSSGMAQNPYFLYDILKRGGFDCTFIVTKKSASRTRYGKYRFITLERALSSKGTYYDQLILFSVPGYEELAELTSRTPSCRCIYINPLNKVANDTHGILGENVPLCNVGVPDLYFLFDEIWIAPHHTHQKEYIQTAFQNDNVKIAPYIWDSHFIHHNLEKSKKKKIFYSPTDGNSLASICIFESNRTFAKNLLIPLSICERAITKKNVTLQSVNVFNCKSPRKTKAFNRIVNTLSLHKEKKIFFNNRWNTVDALARWGGTIVSHQLLNELNYLYLECLYLGRPLIHNSSLLKEYGYFYRNMQIDDAAEQLNIAIGCHSTNFDYYNGKARECLSKYSTYNLTNIEGYKKLLLSV